MIPKKSKSIPEEEYIDIHDDRDIDFWMAQLGLSGKTLVKAVGLVGPDAREVRKWMKKNDPKKKPSLFRRFISFITRRNVKPDNTVTASYS